MAGVASAASAASYSSNSGVAPSASRASCACTRVVRSALAAHSASRSDGISQRPPAISKRVIRCVVCEIHKARVLLALAKSGRKKCQVSKAYLLVSYRALAVIGPTCRSALRGPIPLPLATGIVRLRSGLGRFQRTCQGCPKAAAAGRAERLIRAARRRPSGRVRAAAAHGAQPPPAQLSTKHQWPRSTYMLSRAAATSTPSGTVWSTPIQMWTARGREEGRRCGRLLRGATRPCARLCSTRARVPMPRTGAVLRH